MFLRHLVPWQSTLTFTENFTKIVIGEPLRWGFNFKRKRVAKYSDFGSIEGYISETVQLQVS